MNGGMSLLGIMKLLGHRDRRMALRYTQIADETVGREYFEALTRIAERYELLPVRRKYSVVSWICSGFTDGDVAIAAPDAGPPRRDHPATHRRPPCQEQTIVVRGRNRVHLGKATERRFCP
jgi:hypothetical protein